MASYSNIRFSIRIKTTSQSIGFPVIEAVLRLALQLYFIIDLFVRRNYHNEHNRTNKNKCQFTFRLKMTRQKIERMHILRPYTDTQIVYSILAWAHLLNSHISVVSVCSWAPIINFLVPFYYLWDQLYNISGAQRIDFFRSIFFCLNYRLYNTDPSYNAYRSIEWPQFTDFFSPTISLLFR